MESLPLSRLERGSVYQKSVQHERIGEREATEWDRREERSETAAQNVAIGLLII